MSAWVREHRSRIWSDLTTATSTSGPTASTMVNVNGQTNIMSSNASQPRVTPVAPPNGTLTRYQLQTSAASRNVTEGIGDTQTTITGRLAVYYPTDRPAGYYLIDSLGAIELIPGPGGAGNLYRYEGATIEVTGNLVTQDSRRTLYMEKWAPAEGSAAFARPATVSSEVRELSLLETMLQTVSVLVIAVGVFYVLIKLGSLLDALKEKTEAGSAKK